MRRATLAFVCSLAAALGAAACSTLKTPTQPSADRSPGFGTIAAVQSSNAVVNLADCLAHAGTASCFSTGAMIRTHAVGAAVTAPGAPANLTASSIGSSVTLTWAAAAGGDAPTAYIIEAGSRAGLADLANFSTGSTATVFQASGIGAGTYYVRVRAANAFGPSASSNEAVLVVGGPAGGVPGAPTGLTNTLNAGGTVGFSWNGAAGSPTSYIIEAGSRTGLADLANSDLGSAATSMTATGVGAGTYYVRVRAKNAAGVSGPSNEVLLIVGGALGCAPNLEPTGANYTGIFAATVLVVSSAGSVVTFNFARLSGSDVFFMGPYSDSAGRTGFSQGLFSGNRVPPRVFMYFSPTGGSVVTDGVVFVGNPSACSGGTVLEYSGEAHMGYNGSLACQPGETCISGYHLRGPGYPMTLSRR